MSQEPMNSQPVEGEVVYDPNEEKRLEAQASALLGQLAQMRASRGVFSGLQETNPAVVNNAVVDWLKQPETKVALQSFIGGLTQKRGPEPKRMIVAGIAAALGTIYGDAAAGAAGTGGSLLYSLYEHLKAQGIIK